MKEAALVLDMSGEVIHIHAPEDRSSVSLPDSQSLWDVIWEHRDDISGIAHSHPGHGRTGPSIEDLTTFAPIEAALADRLDWWIATNDFLVLVRWVGPGPMDYRTTPVKQQPPWVHTLRKISGYL